MGAQQGRRSGLPSAWELAELIRAGETVAALGDAFGVGESAIVQRLNAAGWSATTGHALGSRQDRHAGAPSSPGRAPVRAPFPDVDGTQPCASMNPELFFVHPSRPVPGPVAAACATCRFVKPCLAYALTHKVVGIWAGTTEARREELRRIHGIDAAPVELDDDLTSRADQVARMSGGGLRR